MKTTSGQSASHSKQFNAQASALNQLDTAPNPTANPYDPMSKPVRAVPMAKTPKDIQL